MTAIDQHRTSRPVVGLRAGALYGPATFGVTSAAIVLPNLIADLRIGPGEAVWVLSAYALALGVATAVAGRLADAFGVAVVIRVGAFLLTGGFLVCLLGVDLPSLVAGRVAVAAGSGAAVASALTLAGSVPPADRGRAVAGLGAVAAGCAAAATLAGALAAAAGVWRLGLVLPACSLAAVPACLAAAPRPARPGRIDLPGAGLLTVVAGGLLVLTQAYAVALPTIAVAVAAAGTVGAVLLLAWHTIRRPEGFVPLRLLTHPRFARVCGIGGGVYGALFAVMAGVPSLLAHEHGWSALRIGAALLPGAVVGAVLAQVAARRRGDGMRLVAATGAAFTLLMLQVTVVGGPVSATAAATAGLAASAVTQVVLTRWLAANLPERSRGTGAGLLMFAQFLGGAVGAAALAAFTVRLGGAAFAATSSLAAAATLLAVFTRSNANP
ncbi:MFS transporter [Phytohabitans kaempferiae]|uniref:MFS transporter n=1 Tax=Phytohabitans kaempferiae TaxID=1620943 RepID=A0ABV6MAC9_9ACTN